MYLESTHAKWTIVFDTEEEAKLALETLRYAMMDQQEIYNRAKENLEKLRNLIERKEGEWR